ncbi:MAG: primosomal protein N' [Anaerolineales bacterium]
MPTYLEIVVNVPHVEGVFHYHLPAELEGKITPGHLVEVPFGKQHVQGVVLKAVDQPSVAETRAVERLIDSSVMVTPGQIALAEYLSESTLAPLSVCINLMLPVGLSQMGDTLYSLADNLKWSGSKPVSDLQRRMLNLLENRGPLTGRQFDRALPRTRWRSSARALIRLGRIRAEPVLPAPRVQPKSVRTVQLALPPEQIEGSEHELGRAGTKALERRQAVLEYLKEESEPVDVSWVYAASGGNLGDLRYLAKKNLVVLGESEVWRDPLETLSFVSKVAPTLTEDQEKVWQEIQGDLRQAKEGRNVAPILLHGVTGSGKTEIYLRAVSNVLKEDKQAIILVPEIALTPQTVRRFHTRFPGQVGLVHSRLSVGERYDTWRRARQGDISVIIGPRSALFTPLPDIGLIVVDESHDATYYQGEIPPYYHARQAAVAYARLLKAVCILGSATPDLGSYYRALRGEWHHVQLPKRILAHRQAVQRQLAQHSIDTKASHYRHLDHQAETIELPPVKIVDMRVELKSGNRSIFSRVLRESLYQVLQDHQQAILFLNRRGTATYIFCRDCGHSLKCPRCDNPLIYHRSVQAINKNLPAGGSADQIAAHPALICHHCGYRRKMPPTCPNCGSPHIRQFGTGTERVESDLQALFPGIRTLRWDYETTRKKGAHEIILAHFQAQRADILIGTQMLAKGLDLPLVTLVGVVLADVGLNLPDFHAPERTFQILTQVAGRAGRSPLGGQVVLQTYQPEHYVIQAAARHDFQSFYQQELEKRRQIGYPPFSQLVRLEFRHLNADRAEERAHELAHRITGWLAEEGSSATHMIGPVPPFFARLKGEYRWQIILRGPDPRNLLRGRQLRDWRIEVNPPTLL